MTESCIHLTGLAGFATSPFGYYFLGVVLGILFGRATRRKN